MLEIENEPQIMGVLDFIRIIRERWLLGLALGILIAGLWTLYQFSRTPEYTSSVRMLMEIMDDKVINMQQVVDEQEVARSHRVEMLLNQHLVDMKSAKFRKFVINSLTSEERRSILEPFWTDELADPEITTILRKATKFNVDSRVLAFEVSAKHPTPPIAALIADIYCRQYIRYLMSDVGSSNENAISFLGVRAKDLEESITKEENALQAFRRKHSIVSIEASQSLAISQLQQYQSEQTRLTVESQSQETVIGQIEAAGADLPSLLRIPQIASYRNVSRYKQEVELARAMREQMTIDLLERHPRMVENQSVIDQYQRLLESDIEYAVNSLQTSLDKLESQIARNDLRIETTQSEVQRLEELAIEYDSMVRRIASQKATVSRIRQRLNETQISSQLSHANMRIVDSAYIPVSPSSPNLKVTLSVAVALFGLCFVSLPLGLYFFDDKLKTPWDIEEFVQKPMLGEIFRFNRELRKKNVSRLVRDAEDDLIVDTFRGVYNTIKLNDTSHSDKKIQVITSTIPAEGKTMFSMNYGAIVSQHGAKTLMIDCDLRKPRMEEYMNFEVERGLVRWFFSNEPVPNGNVMAASLGIKEISGNCFVLPAGKATNKSTELVESERFKALMDRLSEEFDHIIIDTPPIGVFPDAMFLAEYAQEVIYVSSFDRVPRRTVKHFVNQLDKTKAHVCGVVLNGRKNARSGGVNSYNYAYNSKYAEKYYGKYYKSTKGSY